MEVLSLLANGFSVALTPHTLMLAVAGCIIGTMVGALPGLGPSNGVAILIPLAFSLGLDATQSLVLMTSVYYGAMYGGRISSILLNIPGDEPALMTTLDGYPMAQQGRAGDALVLSGVASFVGATFATIDSCFSLRYLPEWLFYLVLQSTLLCTCWRSVPSVVLHRRINARQQLQPVLVWVLR